MKKNEKKMKKFLEKEIKRWKIIRNQFEIVRFRWQNQNFCSWHVITIKFTRLVFINAVFLSFLGMFEERALVLGRMQRFEQAIGLYVHVLKQANKAEK